MTLTLLTPVTNTCHQRLSPRVRNRSANTKESKAEQVSTPDDEAVLTKTQARDKILRRVRALYTLASRGEEATHEERDGFNLISIERSDLVRWGSSHEWKRGCADRHRCTKCKRLELCQHVCWWNDRFFQEKNSRYTMQRLWGK